MFKLLISAPVHKLSVNLLSDCPRMFPLCFLVYVWCSEGVRR